MNKPKTCTLVGLDYLFRSLGTSARIIYVIVTTSEGTSWPPCKKTFRLYHGQMGRLQLHGLRGMIRRRLPPRLSIKIMLQRSCSHINQLLCAIHCCRCRLHVHPYRSCHPMQNRQEKALNTTGLEYEKKTLTVKRELRTSRNLWLVVVVLKY